MPRISDEMQGEAQVPAMRRSVTSNNPAWSAAGNAKGMSLAEVLMAVVIIGTSFLSVIHIFGLSGVTVAKARWVMIATTIAQSELTALTMQARHPSGWRDIESKADWDISNYAPYNEKFDAELIVEQTDRFGNVSNPDVYQPKKIVLVMKWSENTPGGLVERMMPFGTVVMYHGNLQRWTEMK